MRTFRSYPLSFVYVVVQSLSPVWLCNPMDCGTPAPLSSSITQVCSNSCPMSQWCYWTIWSFAAPFSFCFSLSQNQGLSVESTLRIGWLKFWSFSFSKSLHSPSNEYSGLLSFRIDWFDLLLVQGILKSLLQHHSLKASILWHSVFFLVQLSHPYMTTRKTIGLTLWTFVSKAASLLFNMLFRFVIAFLSRSKHLLISWLQSQSAVILQPKKIKSVIASIFHPSVCHAVMGLDAKI